MRGLRVSRISDWIIGAVVAAGIAIAFLYIFAGAVPGLGNFLPGTGGGYQLEGAFAETGGIEPNSPVRVAGIDVGKVVEVSSGGAADGSPTAIVRMQIDERALPIKEDARMQVRPRLFLEGNYFVDLEPGSPGAPEMASDGTVPLTQTSASVALDEVVTTLQSDVREDLQTVLDQFSKALVRDGGSAGLRKLYRSSPRAFRATSRVNEAVLGTAPNDLSGLIWNLSSVVGTLSDERDRLSSLVVRLQTVTGAFASRSTELGRAVELLPGTLADTRPFLDAVNASLPQTRAFAREALPGLRRLPSAIDETTPFLRQLRGAVSRAEGRGVIADLRRATPPLAALVRDSEPLLGQTRRLASCANEILIPFTNETVEDPDTPANGRIFEEAGYGLVGISGESRSGDANGPYARILGGSGTNAVVLPPVDGGDEVVGIAPQEILGARPAIDSSQKTPFRPKVRCETNDPPDLDSGEAGAPPQQRETGGPAGTLPDDVLAGLEPEIADLGATFERAGKRVELRPRRSLRKREDAFAELERTLAGALGWERLLEGEEDR